MPRASRGRRTPRRAPRSRRRRVAASGSVAIGPIQPARFTEWQPKPIVAPVASRAANAVPSATARSSSGDPVRVRRGREVVRAGSGFALDDARRPAARAGTTVAIAMLMPTQSRSKPSVSSSMPGAGVARRRRRARGSAGPRSARQQVARADAPRAAVEHGARRAPCPSPSTLVRRDARRRARATPRRARRIVASAAPPAPRSSPKTSSVAGLAEAQMRASSSRVRCSSGIAAAHSAASASGVDGSRRGLLVRVGARAARGSRSASRRPARSGRRNDGSLVT